MPPGDKSADIEKQRKDENTEVGYEARAKSEKQPGNQAGGKRPGSSGRKSAAKKTAKKAKKR